MYHYTNFDSSNHCQDEPGVPHVVPGLAGSMCGTPEPSSPGPGNEKPPVNDKGAETICPPSDNRVLIDFLAWTYSKIDDPDIALELTGFDPAIFVDTSVGGMGYRRSLRYMNIVLFYDGNKGMGCHISMTGQGCRQYEALTGGSTHMWVCLFKDILLNEGNFTRIDLAIDNVDGKLSLPRMRHAVRRKTIRTRFKRFKKFDEGTLSRNSTEQNSETIQFGSVKSRIVIKFYNKAVEQEKKNYLDPGSLGHWVRCELLIKDKLAHEAVQNILAGKAVAALAVGVINHYLAVVKVTSDNLSQCKCRRWWKQWLDNSEKIKLTTEKAPQFIQHVMQHLERQYSATFAMLRLYWGLTGFHDFVSNLVLQGHTKITQKHRDIINRSKFIPSSELPF
jgi:phage replication initiation protein